MLPDSGIERWRLDVRGLVQGVGFRPFVYRQAVKWGVNGWVRNNSAGVEIEAQATTNILRDFTHSLREECPVLAHIQEINSRRIEPAGDKGFSISPSGNSGDKSALILPDIAVCPDCVADIFRPGDRRWLYPFTNCTNCGPRFSIVTAIPYDRSRTTMASFALCKKCREEYRNPQDRRFHAQPIACPECGPQIALWDNSGKVIARREDALIKAVQFVKQGKILALKGLGGFQLIAAAENYEAISKLRLKKDRPHKPLAMMFPDFDTVKSCCIVTPLETAALQSVQSPILLLKARPSVTGIDASVSCGNPNFGVMLPYTPLHHIFMREIALPVVATSGNLTEEPMCLDEHQALNRLASVADCFLVHNRPIARVVDDSVAREAAGRIMILRRARGYASLPIDLPYDTRQTLAVGAQQKNTIAFSRNRKVFISQHLGDLESGETFDTFKHTIGDFQRLYSFQPSRTACDTHPDYQSSKFARTLQENPFTIQHHFAHILSCLADNGETGEVLGVAWDGSGYGGDGTLWGGEFLQVNQSHCRRFAHFRLFPLPGGEKAAREPRRSVLGLLYEIFADELFQGHLRESLDYFKPLELDILRRMLKSGTNSPYTSSAGRLFDAAAAVLGLIQCASFEGQAAMLLEFAAEKSTSEEVYPFNLIENKPVIIIDWQPVFQGLLKDKHKVSDAAKKFHNTTAEIILAVAQKSGQGKVALSGGCMQNRLLLETAINRLKNAGFIPIWPRQVPPNDGGIALGQAVYGGIAAL